MSVDKAVLLDEEITTNELFTALSKKKKDASPGPDGLTVSFYLILWHKISGLLTDSILLSKDKGKMSASQRRGILRLIPKKDRNPGLVRNWRPITLLNVDYKILSKLLALRLASILLDLIGMDQCGFVKGRYIGDNVFELYSLIAQAEQDGDPGCYYN